MGLALGLGVHGLRTTGLPYGCIVNEGSLLWLRSRGASTPAIATTVPGRFSNCAIQIAKRRNQSQQQAAESDEFHNDLGKALARLIAALSGASRFYMDSYRLLVAVKHRMGFLQFASSKFTPDKPTQKKKENKITDSFALSCTLRRSAALYFLFAFRWLL